LPTSTPKRVVRRVQMFFRRGELLLVHLCSRSVAFVPPGNVLGPARCCHRHLLWMRSRSLRHLSGGHCRTLYRALCADFQDQLSPDSLSQALFVSVIIRSNGGTSHVTHSITLSGPPEGFTRGECRASAIDTPASMLRATMDADVRRSCMLIPLAADELARTVVRSRARRNLGFMAASKHMFNACQPTLFTAMNHFAANDVVINNTVQVALAPGFPLVQARGQQVTKPLHVHFFVSCWAGFMAASLLSCLRAPAFNVTPKPGE
jgi:hypothetical protein